ncbi:MAG: 5'-methylthioadenosine phosphorylase, partial [Candidatus Binatia bacterium]
QGHLVVTEGLFSRRLARQVQDLAVRVGARVAAEVVFAYVPGPRTKTAAENRLWARLGAQVNSMSLAPEVVLANELEIPCAGLVLGHKYSLAGGPSSSEETLAESLIESRRALERIVLAFLEEADPVPFANRIFRFSKDDA